MTLKKILMAAAIATSGIGVASVLPAAAEPVLVKQVPPEYPRGAERRNIEGSVDLGFVVNADGKPEAIEVLGATVPGVFDAAAIKALEQWKFESGAPGEAAVTIVFSLG